MQALRKLAKQAGSLALVQMDSPPMPGPGEVVLRVAACGVCGSDLHAFNDDPGYEFVRTPVTLGHEYAGEVVAVGLSTPGWTLGDRACAIAIQGCGHCPACLRGDTNQCPGRVVQGLQYDGGMAEYVRVAARHLVRLPDAIDLRAAALIEPLSVALHCAADRTEMAPGDLVVVTGPGIIGMLCGLVARLRGARVIIAGTAADLPARLPVAEQLGLGVVVTGEKSLAEQLPRKADVLIEASGSNGALASAFDTVRGGGAVSLVGMYVEPANWFLTRAVRGELTIRGSYASVHRNYLQAAELIALGRVPVEPLVRHYPLAEGPRAFADALSRKVLKPILIP
ncbi:MAG TPA: alcohol dehydrogenase catalytic domain-containing protein [Symbiobacteriaceae bacterium]|nr:alcohol dehydrogenase catalytic domain-containing protein [Symbiobacteriaceae bacterium]